MSYGTDRINHRHPASASSRARGPPGRIMAEPIVREPRDLYCFGFGGQGALGNRAYRDELSPYLVSSLRAAGGVLLVSCGFDHTVAVCGDLRAWSWGRAQEGQLGNEDDDIVTESPRGTLCVLVPTLVGLCAVDAGASVQGVAAGGMHTVLMTLPRSPKDELVLFSMGRGTEGQLGQGLDGVVEKVAEAQPVELPSELPPVLIAAGGLHSAAVSSHGVPGPPETACRDDAGARPRHVTARFTCSRARPLPPLDPPPLLPDQATSSCGATPAAAS